MEQNLTPKFKSNDLAKKWQRFKDLLEQHKQIQIKKEKKDEPAKQ